MKKKAAVLFGIFLVFLAAGFYVNLQKGLYFHFDFWRQHDKNTYTFLKNEIQYTENEKFVLKLQDREMTAQLLSEGKDNVLAQFSDGIAVKIKAQDPVAFEIGGVYFSNAEEYIILDPEGDAFEFVCAQERVCEAILDEEGNPIGEMILLAAEDGRVLEYREVFFENPQWSMPEKETMVLKSGVHLTESQISSTLFQNPQGEYLVDSDSITMIELSDGQKYARASLAHFLLDISAGKVQIRGEATAIILYIILYGLGALGFLFPVQTALFGQRWKYQGEIKLSDAGRFVFQAVGIVSMILAIVLLMMGR